MSGCCGDDPRIIRKAATELTLKDRVGALKVRCGIGRMSYRVSPGLYAVGDPNGSSPVFVSANYKLTFDSLRKELTGIDCYILILDTKGVNVWCAAGKGTFGTDEIVRRVEMTGLADVVSHRTLILPQLGAPGVSAHAVKKRIGFDVVYGPVRASDIKEFLAKGMEATEEMRRVRFTTRDRIVLTPMEFVLSIKITIIVLALMFLANLIAKDAFGLDDLIVYMGAVLVGTVITPILLPVIPGRAFSLKGWILGICWAAYAAWTFGWLCDDILIAAGYLFLLPAVSSYFAMNFTGSSTYTSFSGVMKEMRIALPAIIIAVIAGTAGLFMGKVVW